MRTHGPGAKAEWVSNGGCPFGRRREQRQFEIVGEALNKASSLDVSLARAVPEIPRIVGLRNRLIHGYDVVDDELVWDIVRSKITPLRLALADLIK